MRKIAQRNWSENKLMSEMDKVIMKHSRKQKLTQAIARRLIENCGRKLIVRNGEFIVRKIGRPVDHASSYYTQDLQDAVNTAKAAFESAQKEAKAKDDAWYSQTMRSV